MNQGHIIRTSAEAVELGRKGGSVRSEKKTRANRLNNQLRALKNKGLSDEVAEQTWKVLIDSDMSHLDIYLYLKSIQKTAVSQKDKENAARLLMEWDKMHHRVGPDTVVNVQNNIGDKVYRFVIVNEYEPPKEMEGVITSSSSGTSPEHSTLKNDE
jgi:hypothetical protein